MAFWQGLEIPFMIGVRNPPNKRVVAGIEQAFVCRVAMKFMR